MWKEKYMENCKSMELCPRVFQLDLHTNEKPIVYALRD
jgi:hypothetical protein